jgi:OmpA-OmpF porin, OOP family
MKTRILNGAVTIGFASVILTGCGGEPLRDPVIDQARADLTSLQSDAQLGSRAPVAMADAESAVREAENAVSDEAEEPERAHLSYLAKRRIEIARTEAQTRVAEDEFKTLSESRGEVQLNARTRQFEAAKAEAEKARKELEDLQAKSTDRGLVLTLGDVLFEFGKADLKAGSAANLTKLVGFLKENPDRPIVIEGHTDSAGSDETNAALSQRRADAVRVHLVSSGIEPGRITAVGKGEGFPVAPNENAAGRQQNRRVEVVIGNAK